MNRSINDLTIGSPVRKILLFTLPLLAGNLFQQLYNMVDMMIVGTTINTNALAAVGATGSVSFLVIGFAQGLTAGFSVITAQHYGAGEEEKVRRSVAVSLVLSVACAVFITVLSILIAAPLLRIMQTPQDIFEDALSYLSVVCLGTTATVFFNLFSSILRALGDSRTPLLFLIIACLLNIGLDFAFILGLSMGVAGAAWATILSQLVSALLCLFYSIKKFPILRLKRVDFQITRSLVSQHLSIGVAMGLQSSMTTISVLIFQVAVNQLGMVSVKAYSAAAKICQLTLQPMSSLGITMATYSAQNFGAQKIKRIRTGVRQGAFIAIAFALAGCLLVHLAGRSLIGLFGIGSEEIQVADQAQLYLSVTSSFYILFGLWSVFRNALQGMGYTRIPMLSAGLEIVLRIICSFGFTSFAGFLGISFVDPVTWAGALALLMTGYFAAIKKVTAFQRQSANPDTEGQTP